MGASASCMCPGAKKGDESYDQNNHFRYDTPPKTLRPVGNFGTPSHATVSTDGRSYISNSSTPRNFNEHEFGPTDNCNTIHNDVGPITDLSSEEVIAFHQLLVDRHDNEECVPFKKRFGIRGTPNMERGFGVYAIAHIRKGDIVIRDKSVMDVPPNYQQLGLKWLYNHFLSLPEEDQVIMRKLPARESECERHKHWLAQRISSSFFGGGPLPGEVLPLRAYINHSCSPNLAFHDRKTLIAAHDISPGEELSMSYLPVMEGHLFMEGKKRRVHIGRDCGRFDICKCEVCQLTNLAEPDMNSIELNASDKRRLRLRQLSRKMRRIYIHILSLTRLQFTEDLAEDGLPLCHSYGQEYVNQDDFCLFLNFAYGKMETCDAETDDSLAGEARKFFRANNSRYQKFEYKYCMVQATFRFFLRNEEYHEESPTGDKPTDPEEAGCWTPEHSLLFLDLLQKEKIRCPALEVMADYLAAMYCICNPTTESNIVKNLTDGTDESNKTKASDTDTLQFLQTLTPYDWLARGLSNTGVNMFQDFDRGNDMLILHTSQFRTLFEHDPVLDAKKRSWQFREWQNDMQIALEHLRWDKENEENSENAAAIEGGPKPPRVRMPYNWIFMHYLTDTDANSFRAQWRPI